MEYLKRCPFCGAEARLVRNASVKVRYGDRMEEQTGAVIGCTNCPAEIRTTDKHLIVDMWNRREPVEMDKWTELKETLQELHGNNSDKPDVENVTRFLLNLMNVKEQKNADIRNCAFMWSDDISFCGGECDWLDCPRNSKNIRDKTVPHSYIIGTPDDCPRKLEE